MKNDPVKSTPARTSGEAKSVPSRVHPANATSIKNSHDGTRVMEQARATQALVAAMPYNANKALECGRDSAVAPPVTCIVVARLGVVGTADEAIIEAAAGFENSMPMLFDAGVLPHGEGGVKRLIGQAQAIDFVAQQFRRGKTLLALGASKALLDRAGVDAFLGSGEGDPGVLLAEANELDAVQAEFVAAHR